MKFTIHIHSNIVFILLNLPNFLLCDAKLVSNPCHAITEEQWNLFEWYFYDTNYIKVVSIFDKKDDQQDYMEMFLLRAFEKFKVGMLVQSFSLEFEDPNFVFTELHSWQGEHFGLRETQNYSNVVYDIKSRIHTVHSDEAHFAIFVICNSPEILEKFIYGSARRPFHTPRGKFILVLMGEITEAWKTSVKSIFSKLWGNHAVLKVIILSLCNDKQFFYYDPFAPSLANNSLPRNFEDWGRLKEHPTGNMTLPNTWLLRRPNFFNGYPITGVMFKRNPTALPWTSLPKSFANNYFCDIRDLTPELGGFDGLVYGNLARFLNFSGKIIKPTGGGEYGYKLDNGSYTDSIGDVLYSRASASFNGRFMTEYETTEIEFAFPIFFDKFCIITPKAIEIPQWVAVFRCYDTFVWLIIILSNTILGYVWYLFKKWEVYKEKTKILFRKENELIFPEHNKLHVLIIEMWIIMTSGVASRLPYRSVERIFLTGCLMLNIIISGTFQGSLTTSYSTKSYYKDIETLEELDRSGLPIGTSSKSLRDIFGQNGSDVINSLSKKFILQSTSTIDQAAFKRDICCIERASDIKIIITSSYELPDGTPLLHVVKDCPRSYFLAFIVRKGWPLLNRFNDILMRFSESGLLNTWYEQAESAIIFDKRLSRLGSILIKSQSFNLEAMQTAFYILLFGLGISLLSFFIELLYKCITTNKIK